MAIWCNMYDQYWKSGGGVRLCVWSWCGISWMQRVAVNVKRQEERDPNSPIVTIPASPRLQVRCFARCHVFGETAHLGGEGRLLSWSRKSLVNWTGQKKPQKPTKTPHVGPCVVLISILVSSNNSEQITLRFDLIIVDSTDFGAAQPLFEERFHRHLRRILAPGGMLVTGRPLSNELKSSCSWSTTADRAVCGFLLLMFGMSFRPWWNPRQGSIHGWYY